MSTGEFSGNPITEWVDERVMRLHEPFFYTDPNGKEWHVPAKCSENKPSWINGATIPRPLWSIVGSPYVGKYRRASIIHDYHVGEGDNPPPRSRSYRREADKMFYHACLTDHCDKKFAAILYIAVTLGTWFSKKYPSKKNYIFGSQDYIENLDEYDLEILSKFHFVKNSLNSSLTEMRFEELEMLVHEQLYKKIKIGDKYYSGIEVQPEELMAGDSITDDYIHKTEVNAKIVDSNKVNLSLAGGEFLLLPSTRLVMKLDDEWFGY